MWWQKISRSAPLRNSKEIFHKIEKKGLTWDDGSSHLLTGTHESDADHGTVEQRLGDVRVEVSDRRGEGGDVLSEQVVGVLYATVQVTNSVIRLVAEVHRVRVVHQPRSERHKQS